MFFLGTILKSINPSIEEGALQKDNDEEELKTLQYDGLQNLAGYICHKLKNKHPSIEANNVGDSIYTWVDHLSEGGLSKPSNLLMEQLKSCDEIFNKLNQSKILITNGYLQKHLSEAKDIEADEEVKKLFFRSRMYFRIRLLNEEIYEGAKTRKRKFNKITT